MHSITYDRTDAEFAHLARSVGDEPMAVVQQNAKAPVGQNFVYLAFQAEQFFFRQRVVPSRQLFTRRKKCAAEPKKREKEEKTVRRLSISVAGDVKHSGM